MFSLRRFLFVALLFSGVLTEAAKHKCVEYLKEPSPISHFFVGLAPYVYWANENPEAFQFAIRFLAATPRILFAKNVPLDKHTRNQLIRYLEQIAKIGSLQNAEEFFLQTYVAVKKGAIDPAPKVNTLYLYRQSRLGFNTIRALKLLAQIEAKGGPRTARHAQRLRSAILHTNNAALKTQPLPPIFKEMLELNL